MASTIIEKVMNSDSYLFTKNEAARLLRINRNKLDGLINEGALQVFLPDNAKTILIPHQEIKNYINQNIKGKYL